MMTAPLMMRVAFAVAGMDAVGADFHLGGDFFKEVIRMAVAFFVELNL